MSIYKLFGIYRITNTQNGKSYIGKTGMNFGDRWDCHRAQLNGGYHDNPHLQRAWNKYGQDSFEFCIVKAIDDVSLLNDLERKYIAQYREAGECYNILDGGDGGGLLGKHLSEETKCKIGEKNRVNMTGRKVSAETKAKMSASQKKRYASWTDEERAAHGRKVAECASGYQWSEESKANFSKLQQTKPNSARYLMFRDQMFTTLLHIADGLTPNITFSFTTYANSVPSQTGDGLEGQTTKTNGLDETMKSVL